MLASPRTRIQHHSGDDPELMIEVCHPLILCCLSLSFCACPEVTVTSLPPTPFVSHRGTFSKTHRFSQGDKNVEDIWKWGPKGPGNTWQVSGQIVRDLHLHRAVCLVQSPDPAGQCFQETNAWMILGLLCVRLCVATKRSALSPSECANRQRFETETCVL